ncbi:helix-turn-helix domain-containing protein [Yinghuangia sp. ASG 101]|uniref:helix-turn-helix domain-containing protein n=1 Tax=Yinghuangia sp. ASG 101 TaxID=2896848 RepID=UPI001E3104D6|nr:helix-turn-helix transcriptional regulator [Yinghuangia sp. ASG 101]UGQ09074.1 helix-turn-helix domain-containing protein [Yinghuangia sp. ASG 101]
MTDTTKKAEAGTSAPRTVAAGKARGSAEARASAHTRLNVTGTLSAEAQAGAEWMNAALDLAQAVYDLRTAKGWSQRQLAEAAGMKQGAISRIEQAGTLPTLPVVLRLADALDAKVVIVVDRDNGEKAIEFTMTPHAAAAA